MINLDPEVDKVISKWIHKEYGRRAGLLEHEYKVLFDERGNYDVEVKAGKTILIMIARTPFDRDFKSILSIVFGPTWKLREFLHVPGGLRNPDKTQWYEMGASNLTIETPKKVSVHSYERKWITSLELTDKKTKKKVMVKVVGSAFEAEDVAVKMLYGELDAAPLSEASVKTKRE